MDLARRQRRGHPHRPGHRHARRRRRSAPPGLRRGDLMRALAALLTLLLALPLHAQTLADRPGGGNHLRRSTSLPAHALTTPYAGTSSTASPRSMPSSRSSRRLPPPGPARTTALGCSRCGKASNSPTGRASAPPTWSSPTAASSTTPRSWLPPSRRLCAGSKRSSRLAKTSCASEPSSRSRCCCPSWGRSRSCRARWAVRTWCSTPRRIAAAAAPIRRKTISPTARHRSAPAPIASISYSRAATTVLARRDDYWGAKPHWAEVRSSPITAPASRLAALLAGDQDLIEAQAPPICSGSARTPASP